MTYTFKPVVSNKTDIHAFAAKKFERESANVLAVKNLKALNVDLAGLVKTSPFLALIAMSIFGTDNYYTDSELAQMWQNYVQADARLQAAGAYDLHDDRDVKMNDQIQAFLDKVNAPKCLINVSDLEDIIGSSTKRGVTTSSVEYNALMRLIETAYGADHRSFFSGDSDYAAFGKIMGYTPDEVSATSRESSMVSERAAEMCLFMDMWRSRHELADYDFWYYLLNHEFTDVTDGSTRTMYAPEPLNTDAPGERVRIGVSEFINHCVIPHDLTDAFYRVIFKELAQVLGNVESIKCDISW